MNVVNLVVYQIECVESENNWWKLYSLVAMVNPDVKRGSADRFAPLPSVVDVSIGVGQIT